MAGINKVILVGNLGKDPEIRYTSDNTPVATFSVATTESYNKNGEWVEITEWHNIVAWRYLAEKAQKFLQKGKQVYIEGKIRNRSYDDKEGNKRYTIDIVADVIQPLGKREDGEGSNNGGGYANAQSQQQPQAQPQQAAQTAPPVPLDDDLPF
jgi:single-strand DNA-binding protein